jgi:hypothetical protein
MSKTYHGKSYIPLKGSHGGSHQTIKVLTFLPSQWLIDWLVFNANVSSISTISWHYKVNGNEIYLWWFDLKMVFCICFNIFFYWGLGLWTFHITINNISDILSSLDKTTTHLQETEKLYKNGTWFSGAGHEVHRHMQMYLFYYSDPF